MRLSVRSPSSSGHVALHLSRGLGQPGRPQDGSCRPCSPRPCVPGTHSSSGVLSLRLCWPRAHTPSCTSWEAVMGSRARTVSDSWGPGVGKEAPRSRPHLALGAQTPRPQPPPPVLVSQDRLVQSRACPGHLPAHPAPTTPCARTAEPLGQSADTRPKTVAVQPALDSVPDSRCGS